MKAADRVTLFAAQKVAFESRLNSNLLGLVIASDE